MRLFRTAIACLACVLIAQMLLYGKGRSDHPGSLLDDEGTALLERFLSDTDMSLRSYYAFRTLEASTCGGRMHAHLTAWTSVDPDRGFQYSIVEEVGSGVLRAKVLRAALEAERSLRAAGELTRGALTTANYDFTAGAAAEDGLVRIGIRPKRRDGAGGRGRSGRG